MLKDRPIYSARKPHFSKVMVKDLQKRTRIPRAFIEQMPEELSGITILQGPSGNGWPVKIMKFTNGTYLEDGWEAFVTDHSLTEGEILIFTYVPRMNFKVKIFGRNACEREDAFTVQASLKSPRGDERKFTAKDTFTFKASHGSTCLKERKKCQSRRHARKKISSTSKSKVFEEKANTAACYFTSQFPYFVIQIKSYCLGDHRYLALPAAFVKKLVPQTRMMTIWNANGGKWKVKYCHNIGWPSVSLKGGNHLHLTIISKWEISVRLSLLKKIQLKCTFSNTRLSDML